MIKCFLFFFLSVVSLKSFATDNDVQRFALVIGNKNYANAPLKNALNDANSIGDSLTELGFKVSLIADSNLPELKQAVTEFYSAVKTDTNAKKLALIYYAGHAIQVNQHNYIVPLGHTFENYHEFISGLYQINNLFAQINQTQSLQSIIILDACRNNPFENQPVLDTAKISNGLAPVKAPFNTMIAFATEPGGVAADGRRKNGIYTKHLLRHLWRPINVEEVFKRVRTGVTKETRNKQIPWEHSSLLTEVFFNPPKNRDIPDLMVF